MATARKLSVREKRYIAYCEQHYWARDGFPSTEQAAVALKATVSDIRSFLNSLAVQEAFDRRGLPWRTADYQAGVLSPTQVAVAVTVTNFADTRTLEQKLGALGVLPEQYFTWIQDKTFNEFVNSIADKALNGVRHEAIAEFTKLVRGGDDVPKNAQLNAIKYYFELTGQAKSPEVQNIKIVIEQLIESVQRHVADPVILANIAKDMMAIAPVAADHVQISSSQISSSQISEREIDGDYDYA